MGQQGFTLIELISTLVIISTLAAVLIQKYVDVEQSSRMQAIDLGLAELNGRETLTWALVKLSDTGYGRVNADAEQIWPRIDTNISADFDWVGAPPLISGGTLRFKRDTSAVVVRSPSSREAPGKWRR